MADTAFQILSQHGLVYLAAEERTGKTIAAILTAEMCKTRTNVLVLTKKGKPLDGWIKTLSKFPHEHIYKCTNYHQAHKQRKPDLLILDEAHNYISGSPKPSALHGKVAKLSKDIPIIYISATPHPQGYQQLYHQLSLSSFSPFRRYENFYQWFNDYGVPTTQWLYQKEVPIYTNTQEQKIRDATGHLFITKTRKELGFKYEPKDVLHYVELSPETIRAYNILLKDKVLEFEDKPPLVCDTAMKLRTSLHMLEGGVAKIDDEYFVLRNREKIDYILDKWGDTKDMAIYYQYVAEGRKLRKHFRHAEILQASTHAEGIELAHIDTLIIYSQNFSTGQHTQRRARQASQARQKEIEVHFLLVGNNAVSQQVYNIVSVNKKNFVDELFERTYL